MPRLYYRVMLCFFELFQKNILDQIRNKKCILNYYFTLNQKQTFASVYFLNKALQLFMTAFNLLLLADRNKYSYTSIICPCWQIMQRIIINPH